MIKMHENIDTYSLSNLYNILKAHESEPKEIADEKDIMNFGGPLGLISKTSAKELCSDSKKGVGEEGLIMNSDD